MRCYTGSQAPRAMIVVDAARELLFHGAVSLERRAVRVQILALLCVLACHKEAPTEAPTEEKGCSGARCVEMAEAAMMYKDHEQAREPLERVCATGDGFQCFRLGELYQFGRGGPVDMPRALEVFEASCKYEHGEACERRADLARDGQGGPTVELEYAVKACEQQRSVLCTRAGAQVRDGRGVERDLQRAAELFLAGCRTGDPDGCVGAGDILAAMGRPDTKAQALAAYINGCVGHNGYGCMRVGLAMYTGVGAKKDVAGARNHFDKACQYQVDDGCVAVKDIDAAGGKEIDIRLTTTAPELVQRGLPAREFSCRMEKEGIEALERVLASVAREKDKIDACAKDGAAVPISWEFEKGKVVKAAGREKIGKVGNCVAWNLRKAKIAGAGACKAVLMIGDPGGAAKALEARAARIEARKEEGRRNVMLAEEAEE